VTLGHDLAIQTISEAAGSALSFLAESLPPDSIALPLKKPLFKAVWLGGAGLDRATDISSVHSRLMTLFALPHPDTLLVTNDAALLASAIILPVEESLDKQPQSKDGVVLIMGTGSIAYGFNIASGLLPPNVKGQPLGYASSFHSKLSVTPLNRTSGWGYLLGDEGSAYSIGREAVRRALHHRDLGLPPTKLHLAIAEYFAVKSVGAIISAVYAPNFFVEVEPEFGGGKGGETLNRDPKLRIAGLAKVVVTAAFPEPEQGEPNEEALEVVKSVVDGLINHVSPLLLDKTARESMQSPLGSISSRIDPRKSTLVLGGGLCQVKRFREVVIEHLRREGIVFEGVEVVGDAASCAVRLLRENYL
jgi:N-acetylmuramic acid 6-phosphate etherase